MARPPPQYEYTDLPASTWVDWSIDAINDALNQHEQGQFYGAATLAEAMTRDDRIAACLNTRVMSLLRAPFEVEQSDKGNKTRARQARKAIEDNWDTIAPKETLGLMLRWVIMLGFCPVEILWEPDGWTWMPRLKVWHPQFVYYHLIQRQYAITAQEGVIYVDPEGTDFGKWFIYAPFGMYRGWMSGAVRALARPWMVRTVTLRDWVRFSEVHGMPIRKALVPSQADVGEKAAFWNAIASLGNETVIEVPQGPGPDAPKWDLDLLEAKNADAWNSFQALIENCDKRIAIELLGQNLTTEAGSGAGGTLGSAKVHELMQLGILEADVEGLASGVRKALLRPFAEFNFGDRTVAPIPKWDPAPTDDEKDKGAAIASFATATATMLQSGIPVDVRTLAERFDVPLVPEAPAAPEDDGDDDAPPADDDAPPDDGTTSRAQLAGDRHGVLLGQLYADNLADKAKGRAIALVRPTKRAVLEAAKAARSYEDLRARLVKVAHQSNPARLAKLVERTGVLAHVAGRHAMRTDNKTGS